MADDTTSRATATQSPTTEGAKQLISDRTADAPAFSWSVPLQISGHSATFLDRSRVHENDNEQELSIPREVIAEVVSGSRLVAELKRPIKIGEFNELPAYLLQIRFSFQRASSNWLYRIQAAEITIVFENAPMNEPAVKVSKNKQQHPAIASWHPTLFEGEVSHALITESVNAGLEASYLGAGASVGTEKSKTYVTRSLSSSSAQMLTSSRRWRRAVSSFTV